MSSERLSLEEDAAQDAAPTRRYLQPGEVAVAGAGELLVTILGSCVAVCLHDPVSRVGGMNHFLLPGDHGASTRHAEGAGRELLRRLDAAGGRHERLQAKVFGGAAVVAAFRNRERHLGLQNAEAALHWLARADIPLVAHDVAGHKGRRLEFAPHSGVARVRLLGEPAS